MASKSDKSVKTSLTFDDIVTTRSPEKLKVFITSWNMGNAPEGGLNNVFTEKNATDSYDVIVLGLQESTYKTKDGADCVAQLSLAIETILGSRFFKVKHAQRAQMQLFVFAKSSLQGRISNVQYSVENTGFLHVFPNKGGILVTMQVDGTKLAFISCHLTAHEGVKHCEERNASIAEIFGGVRAGDERFDVAEQFHHVFWMGDMNYRTTFDTVNLPANTKKNIKELNEVALQRQQGVQGKSLSGKTPTTAPPTDASRVGDAESKKAALTSASSDSAGFGADSGSESEGEDEESLMQSSKENASLSDKAAKKKEWKEQHRRTMDMVVNERWADILALDELNREIAAGRVLNQFTALQPSFPPTFKRTRNVSIQRSGVASSARQWELSTDGVAQYYHHKRIPSFTDRILHKSLPAFAANLKNHFFESCENATSSDHKPVRAGFEVTLCKGDAEIVIDRQLIRWKGKVSKKTSGTRADAQMLRMTFSDLRGENLEEMDSAVFGGGSDPYIVITADPGALLLYKGTLNATYEGVRSSTIMHNLNPVWKETLDIALASIDLKNLCRNASLIVSVWDYDRSNADDLIGVMSIPIREVLRAHSQGNTYVFNESLHSNTEIMGRLSGRITVQGTFKSLLAAYEKLDAERDNEEKYVTLKQALNEHSMAAAAENCACSLS